MVKKKSWYQSSPPPLFSSIMSIANVKSSAKWGSECTRIRREQSVTHTQGHGLYSCHILFIPAPGSVNCAGSIQDKCKHNTLTILLAIFKCNKITSEGSFFFFSFSFPLFYFMKTTSYESCGAAGNRIRRRKRREKTLIFFNARFFCSLTKAAGSTRTLQKYSFCF